MFRDSPLCTREPFNVRCFATAPSAQGGLLRCRARVSPTQGGFFVYLEPRSGSLQGSPYVFTIRKLPYWGAFFIKTDSLVTLHSNLQKSIYPTKYNWTQTCPHESAQYCHPAAPYSLSSNRRGGYTNR